MALWSSFVCLTGVSMALLRIVDFMSCRRAWDVVRKMGMVIIMLQVQQMTLDGFKAYLEN